MASPRPWSPVAPGVLPGADQFGNGLVPVRRVRSGRSKLGLNVIMDNPLWDRLRADVRLHADGSILAGRKMAAIAATLDGGPEAGQRDRAK